MTAPTLAGEWVDRGMCVGGESADWTIDSTFLTENNWRAIAICRYLCPVLDECRTAWRSLPNDDRRGVIGGGDAYTSRGEPWLVELPTVCAGYDCVRPLRPGSLTRYCSHRCEVAVLRKRDREAQRRERLAGAA